MAKTQTPPSNRIVSEELYKTVTGAYSGAWAKRAVENISTYHRIQATAGLRGSLEYIASELDGHGLDELKIHSFPSTGRKRYFNDVSPIGWEGRRAVLSMTAPEEKTLAAFPDVAAAICPGSKAAKNVQAELVFVGPGSRDEHYKGKTIKGKIVLSTGSPRAVQREAVMKRGALGSVHYPAQIDFPDRVRYYGLFPEGKEINGFTFAFSVSRRTGEQLRNLVDSGKRIKVVADVDAKLFPSSMDVLRASLKGSEKPDEEIGIIAHICHPRPGANDNASGAAAALEAARTLAALVKSGKIKRPKRTVSFVWTPEFHGTYAYLHHKPEYAEKLKFLLNLDMVGEDQHACNSQMFVVSEPHSCPGVASDVMHDLFSRMQEKGVYSHDGTRNVLNYTGIRPFKGGSDHQILSQRTWGVPSVHVLNWPDNFYHTSWDEPHYTDASMLKRVGAATLAAAYFLASPTEADVMRLISHAESTRRARFSTRIAQARAGLLDLAANKNKTEAVRFFKKTVDEISALRISEARGMETIAKIAETDFARDTLVEAQVDFDVFTRTQTELFGWFASHVSDRFKLPSFDGVKPDKLDGEMNKLVPRFKKAGPLNLDDFREKIGKKAWEYYNKNIWEKDNGYGHAWEAVNFADGKNSVFEIYVKLSAEFENVDKEFVHRFFTDLEKAGLVAIRKKKN